jgi:hypothetical protein
VRTHSSLSSSYATEPRRGRPRTRPPPGQREERARCRGVACLTGAVLQRPRGATRETKIWRLQEGSWRFRRREPGAVSASCLPETSQSTRLQWVLATSTGWTTPLVTLLLRARLHARADYATPLHCLCKPLCSPYRAEYPRLVSICGQHPHICPSGSDFPACKHWECIRHIRSSALVQWILVYSWFCIGWKPALWRQGGNQRWAVVNTVMKLRVL